MVEMISSLPSIGRKSAVKIAFHFLKQPREYTTSFQESIDEFVDKISYCQECGALKSISEDCKFCDRSRRLDEVICVIEEPSDLFVIESSNEFKGLYHILMGVLSPLDGITPEDLRLQELKNRVQKNKNIKEIILATNPTLEGNATANYICSMLSDFKDQVKFTRIASGLAVGTRLEYADSQIISESIKKRSSIFAE